MLEYDLSTDIDRNIGDFQMEETVYGRLSKDKSYCEKPSPIAQDLRIGGRWFDPQLGQYSFRGLMTAIATGFILLSPLFDNGYVGNQPAAWEEYCAESW